MVRILKWTAVGLCGIIGVALGLGLYAAKSLQPAGDSGHAVTVAIPQGIGSGEIAGLLEQEGVIRSARIFAYYLKYRHQGDKFQAGRYLLDPGMTPDQIIAKLNSGDIVKEEGLRFTIPEGYSLEQIAERLAQQGIVNADAFLQAADHYSGEQTTASSQIPADSELHHRLEGYLFPETYELEKGSSETDIIAKMLKETDKKLDELPDGWREQMKMKGLTLHQVLTIASLIEREVVLDQERPLVASVIYNRLNRGQPLQIDATIQYLFDKPKDRLFEKDLQIESPYNTYLHAGLPPGPIASPGMESIKAALYPAETNNFYYVTKKDGSQGHLFAETFEQHVRNKEESQKNP